MVVRIVGRKDVCKDCGKMQIQKPMILLDMKKFFFSLKVEYSYYYRNMMKIQPQQCSKLAECVLNRDQSILAIS